MCPRLMPRAAQYCIMLQVMVNIKSLLGHCLSLSLSLFAFWLAYYLGRCLGACHEHKEVCCMTDSDFDSMVQQICQGVMNRAPKVNLCYKY